MKYVPSIAFDEMSGSAKGVTAAKVRGRKYIRNRGYGGAARTSAQAAVKSIFKQLSQSWRNLTNAQILAWNALANPPALQGVEAPTEAVITLTPTKFTFELEGEPEGVENLKLIVQASAPQSNGVTRAYSKAVQIGGPLEAVTEEYDLKKDYDEKHGVPNAASPKVFIKYFFVNTVTGEKSGEMLVLATLQEDQPDGE